MNEFVLGVVGVVARGDQFGAGCDILGILAGRPGFQFIDARLGVVVGGLRGEADESGFHGVEVLEVALEVHRCPQAFAVSQGNKLLQPRDEGRSFPWSSRRDAAFVPTVNGKLRSPCFTPSKIACME